MSTVLQSLSLELVTILIVIDIKNAPFFTIFKRVIKPFLRVRQNAT